MLTPEAAREIATALSAAAHYVDRHLKLRRLHSAAAADDGDLISVWLGNSRAGGRLRRMRVLGTPPSL
jgi:hypothetical protein